MWYTGYLVCFALAQISSAQVVSYMPRNSIPQQITTNVPNSVNNAKAAPSNAIKVARAVPVASSPVGNANAAVSSANLASANLANANLANANIANINAAIGAANHNIATGNYAGYANAANANAAYASHNAANPYTSNSGIIPAQINTNLNPTLPNPAIVNVATIATESLPTINGNVATFNLGTNGNTFTITSGSPGAQGFGLTVIADALEVGGTVAVNGQIPIFGSVAVNGNLPTDGSAAVNYNCGGKQVAVALER